MAPFEALCGRKCRAPLRLLEVGEKNLLGLDIVQQTTEKIKIIRENYSLLRVDRKAMLIIEGDL